MSHIQQHNECSTNMIDNENINNNTCDIQDEYDAEASKEYE